MYDPCWSFFLNRTVRRTQTCGTPTQSIAVTGSIISRLWAGTRGTGGHTARPYRLRMTRVCTLCFPPPCVATQTGRTKRQFAGSQHKQGHSVRKKSSPQRSRKSPRAQRKASSNMTSPKWTSQPSYGNTSLRRSATERNWVRVCAWNGKMNFLINTQEMLG